MEAHSIARSPWLFVIGRRPLKQPWKWPVESEKWGQYWLNGF
jgi:hypothetical protein